MKYIAQLVLKTALYTWAEYQIMYQVILLKPIQDENFPAQNYAVRIINKVACNLIG